MRTGDRARVIKARSSEVDELGRLTGREEPSELLMKGDLVVIKGDSPFAPQGDTDLWCVAEDGDHRYGYIAAKYLEPED